MKQYTFLVILQIMAICLLSIVTYILLFKKLWFSAIIVWIVLIVLGTYFYRLQMMHIRTTRQLAKSLRNDDMMLSFRAPYRNRAIEEMIDELSQSMKIFRSRAMERNEIEAWQKLIRVLTHEIMNSITPILSLSETLSEREVSEKNYAIMQQGMQTIYRRSKGLLEFVENYRKLTRLPAPVRSSVAVSDLFTHLQELFAEPYIHISLPEPDSDKTLHIDRTQIEQVMINLIKNAIEACADVAEPSIDIAVQPSQSWQCIITIRDNGCGILQDAIDEVFVPFYTTKPQGSGIGLSLCKQIMNSHGGKISVQSFVGQGSCFTLQF